MNTSPRPRRLVRLMAALVAFVATSAALHAVAHDQGWNSARNHHAWQHDHCADTGDTRNGAAKPAL